MTTPDLLTRALQDPGVPPLRPLPPRAAELLRLLDAPPRLAAHLRAVHDVAHQLADWLDAHHPRLRYDRDAVLFGAALHDVGKVVHTDELSGAGSRHEETGRRLLLDHGIAPELARFAATHASWSQPSAETGVEDLVVSVADKVWKNKRVPDLEDLLVARLAAASGREAWEEFVALDDLLTRVGEGADARLRFQSSYPAAAQPARGGPGIRRATARDAKRLTRLVRGSGAYRGHYAPMVDGYRVGPDYIEAHEVFVATDGGDRVLGFYALVLSPPELDLMFVADEAQGLGIGRLLVGHLTGRAREAGVDAVRIVAHPPAEGFYLSVGARRTGTARARPPAVMWDRPELLLPIP